MDELLAGSSGDLTIATERIPEVSAVFDPVEDVRAQPKSRAAASEVDDWTRHVGVASLIQADTVRVRQPEERSEFT
jgi:hypothetical protein